MVADVIVNTEGQGQHVSKVGHREVDHENDGFVFLADEAAQNPQGCTVGQKTRDEYDDVGGCIEGVLKFHISDIAVSLNITITVANHLEQFSVFTKVSLYVIFQLLLYEEPLVKSKMHHRLRGPDVHVGIDGINPNFGFW